MPVGSISSSTRSVSASSDSSRSKPGVPAASEAVTNAVLHAFSPGGAGEMTAALRRDGDELELVVSDNGRGLVPRTDSPGMGMGLGIIAEVCDRLSIAADGGRGTELHMWFRLPG